MLVFVDHCAGIGGGQVVLAELVRELHARSPHDDVAVVCPPGALADRLAAAGASVVTSTNPADALEAVSSDRDVSRVVVNGLRWLPHVVRWRAAAGRRGGVELVYIEHSTPGTIARKVVASVLLGRVDRVIRVTAGAKRRRNLAHVPPLGLGLQRYTDLAARALGSRTGQVKAMGRLDPVKGLDLLATAFPQLEQRHRSIDLQVAVAPPLEPGSSSYAKKTLERLAPFLVDGRRDSGWFAPGDVVVIPSRSEMACLTAQEAMAAGAVVVAARVGDLPALIEDGVSGFLFTAESTAGLVAAASRAITLGDAEFTRIAATARARVSARAGVWYAAASDLLAEPAGAPA